MIPLVGSRGLEFQTHWAGIMGKIVVLLVNGDVFVDQLTLAMCPEGLGVTAILTPRGWDNCYCWNVEENGGFL